MSELPAMLPPTSKSLLVRRLLKPAFSKIALALSTVPVWKGAYHALDAYGNFQTVEDNVGNIWKFLGSWWGAVALMLLGFALLWWQMRKQQMALTTPPDIDEATARVGQSQVEQTLIRSQARVGELEQQLGVLQARYDDIEWLRESANIQSLNISRYIKGKCWILDSELQQESRLFIDFRLSFNSYCVSRLSFEGMEGFIKYYAQRFASSPTLVSREFKNVQMGGSGSLTIRQKLTKEEAALILNREHQFTFDELRFSLEICPGAGPGRLESVRVSVWADNKLLERNPKLKMDAKEIKLQGFIDYDMGSKGWDNTKLASTLNIKLQLENPRRLPVEIQRFILLTITGGKERHTSAQSGPICDDPRLKNEEIEQSGNSLSNLNRCPISANFGDPLEGWLQFIVRDLSTRHLHGERVTIIAVDSRGEEHPLGVSVPA